MPDIRYVCLSDMHLGEEDSLFTNLENGGTNIDFGSASPVMEHIVECFKTLIAGNDSGKKPTLILNGDILEMALATTNEAAMVFDHFIKLVMPENAELFEKIIYIPGNHDHHLWETAREVQYADYIKRKTVPCQKLERPWHTTEMFFDKNTPRVSSYFLTNLVQRYEHLKNRKFKIHVAYPNFGLTDENREKCVIFHHGHYIEWIYRLMTRLKGMVFPEQKKRFVEMNTAEVEAENFAWIDFFWSALGRSGTAGKDVEVVYESLNNPKARRKLIRSLSKGIADEIDIPVLWESAEAKAIGVILNFFADKFGGTERSQDNEALSEDGKEDRNNYLIGPLRKQLLKECNDKMPGDVTFVLGHTHKPYEEDIDDVGFSGYPHCVNAFNSGGWVVESEKPQPLRGGSVILVDEKLNTVALRMYNDVKHQGDYSVNVKDATHPSEEPNPLHTHIKGLVDMANDPWKSFNAVVYREVKIRKDNMRKRISERS